MNAEKRINAIKSRSADLQKQILAFGLPADSDITILGQLNKYGLTSTQKKIARAILISDHQLVEDMFEVTAELDGKAKKLK